MKKIFFGIIFIIIISTLAIANPIGSIVKSPIPIGGMNADGGLEPILVTNGAIEVQGIDGGVAMLVTLVDYDRCSAALVGVGTSGTSTPADLVVGSRYEVTMTEDGCLRTSSAASCTGGTAPELLMWGGSTRTSWVAPVTTIYASPLSALGPVPKANFHLLTCTKVTR
jgi:hypothetical protein